MQSSSASASSNRTALALALLLIGACGGGAGPAIQESGATVGDGSSPVDGAFRICPWMEQPGCPDGGAPSYTADVAPIVARRCLPGCHEPGGLSQNKPLGTRALIFSRRGTVLTQVYGCRMPPVEKPPLAEAEGLVLLEWLACGSPDN